MKKVKSRKAPAKATRRQPVAKANRKTGKPKPASSATTRSKSGTRAKLAANRRSKRASTVGPALNIRELDPLRVCGDRTSVVQLFRVDEQLVTGKAAGARQVHLVFNDRHGWYCEHGRSCHAVSAVMRHARIR